MNLFDRDVFMKALEKRLNVHGKHFTTSQYQSTYFIAKEFAEKGKEEEPGKFYLQTSGNKLAKEILCSTLYLNSVLRTLMECDIIQTDDCSKYSVLKILCFNFNFLKEE